MTSRIDLRPLSYTRASLLQEACSSARDKTLLEFPSRGFRETYGEFQDQVNRVANLLVEKGISRGGNVAIMSDNSPELLHASYAITLTGALWVPLNTLLVGESLKYIVDASDSSHVIVSARYRQQIEQAVGKIKRPIQVLGLEELDAAARAKPAEYQSPTQPGDTCYLLFTSGTTGLPKGVLHTHNSLIKSSIGYANQLETTAHDHVYMQLPFFHIWANITLNGVIYYKATIVVEERFNAEAYWENVHKYQITQDHWTGTMPLRLLKLPETDLERKAKMNIGGTLGAMYETLKAKWPNLRFQSFFGMSEHLLIAQVWPDNILPGDGVPNPLDDVLILDEAEKPLPPGQTGEIVVRCRCGLLMQGYYKNPEATAAVWRGGCFFTGDLGYFDQSGYLHFAGRKKEALRVRGEMISIDHTEQLINQHPGVAESAITAYRPPEKEAIKEDEVVAHVVVRQGQTLTPEEFLDWAEKNLPKFMRPRYLFFREALPKTATQKIERFKLKAEGIQGATRLF